MDNRNGTHPPKNLFTTPDDACFLRVDIGALEQASRRRDVPAAWRGGMLFIGRRAHLRLLDAHVGE